MFTKSSNLADAKVQLEPTFYARSQEKIKYSQHLPCDEKKYQEIPVEEFASTQGIEWTDAIVMEPKKRIYFGMIKLAIVKL